MNHLDKLILFTTCLSEVYIFYDFFKSFMDRKELFEYKRNIIIFNIAVTVLIFIINMQKNAHVNLIGVSLILWIYANIMYVAIFKYKFIYYIIFIWVLWGCEFLFVILLSIPSYFLKETSFLDFTEIPWQIFTMKLLTYIILAIIKQFSHKSKSRINNRVFFMYLLIPVSSLCIMILTYYLTDTAIRQIFIQLMLTVCFFLILLGNICIFYVFNRYLEEMDNSIKYNMIITKQDADINYYQHVEILNNEYEEFIHNISHYLKTIGELAKANQNNKIEELIAQLDIQLENSIITLFSENHVINAILNEKKNEAAKKGINYDAYVEPGVIMGDLTDMDIITIMGNLLDNAILAAGNSESRNVNIRIFMQNEGSFTVIKIVNDFSGELVKSEKGYVTTKNEKGIHGIGIQSVKNTIEKYEGYLECFSNHNVFTAILIIPYKISSKLNH